MRCLSFHYWLRSICSTLEVMFFTLDDFFVVISIFFNYEMLFWYKNSIRFFTLSRKAVSTNSIIGAGSFYWSSSCRRILYHWWLLLSSFNIRLNSCLSCSFSTVNCCLCSLFASFWSLFLFFFLFLSKSFFFLLFLLLFLNHFLSSLWKSIRSIKLWELRACSLDWSLSSSLGLILI